MRGWRSTPGGRNGYGCSPAPAPQLLCFASSTASPISERAYARAEQAREQLMHAAIGLGLDEALDRRTEEMRHELQARIFSFRPMSGSCSRRRAPIRSSTRWR